MQLHTSCGEKTAWTNGLGDSNTKQMEYIEGVSRSNGGKPVDCSALDRKFVETYCHCSEVIASPLLKPDATSMHSNVILTATLDKRRKKKNKRSSRTTHNSVLRTISRLVSPLRFIRDWIEHIFFSPHNCFGGLPHWPTSSTTTS